MRSPRLAFLSCAFAAAAGCARNVPAQEDPAPPPPKVVGLTDDVTSLPIVMVREFPFVAATVNGVPGKLMFDTGHEGALSLNDRKVPLKDGKVVGKGVFGSGQTFEVKRYPEVAAVDLAGGPRYRAVPGVTGKDLGFMEKAITPDFLGFLGHDFYRGYVFKLDYKAGRVTFFRQTDARRKSRDYLAGEALVAAVPFKTRKLPNHPIVPVTIGGVDFLGSFDTGMGGSAYITKATHARLTAQRLLTLVPARGQPYHDVAGVRLSPDVEVTVDGIQVFSGRAAPAAEPMGTPEPDTIQFGFAFLRQYKTVWDFGEQKIYLLKP